MSNGDAAREETLARLASSRAEIRRLLEPPPREPEPEGSAAGGGVRDAFPRSRTMKLLTSGRGFGTLGALLGGLLGPRWLCGCCACCRSAPWGACWW